MNYDWLHAHSAVARICQFILKASIIENMRYAVILVIQEANGNQIRQKRLRRGTGGRRMNLTEIIQAIEDYMDASLGVNGEITRRAKEAIEALKASCSETPNNSDCISRQAAINAIEFGITYAKAINKETGEVKELFRESNDELRKAADRIKQLPSAQPEVIRCKDCVNYRNYYDTKEQEERYVCALDGFIWKPEGYCSYAERKTADDNDKTD